MNCSIYARVSSQEQTKGYSIDSQIEACREYAARQGWTVIKEYIDAGLSGTNATKRPAFQQIVADGLAGNFSIILVYSFDRFARNMEDATVYKALLRRSSIQVVSVIEPVDNSPIGFIQENILDIFAAYYSINLSVKVKTAISKAKKNGRWPHPLPLGYERDQQKQAKISAVGELLRQSFQEFATGRYTLLEWANYAHTTLGIRAPRGGKLYASGWHRIFHNTFYIGKVQTGDVEIEGVHEPLIDVDIWNRVQQVLQDNAQGRVLQNYRTYRLRGMVWSVDTGTRMSGTTAKDKFPYYRSAGQTPAGVRHYVSAQLLENKTASALNSVHIKTEDIHTLAPAIDETLQMGLRVASSVGALYAHLDDTQQLNMLRLVIARYGLHISGDEIVAVYVKSPFFCECEFDLEKAPWIGLVFFITYKIKREYIRE